MNKIIDVDALITLSNQVQMSDSQSIVSGTTNINDSVCRISNMVSDGCAMHVDMGFTVPPVQSCARFYCNGFMMPIPTYICGATYNPNEAQGIVDKNNPLDGTCVKLLLE